MNSVKSMSYPLAISSGDTGFLAAIFPRRDVELGAEHAPEVGGTVEPVVKCDGGDGAARGRTLLQHAAELQSLHEQRVITQIGFEGRNQQLTLLERLAELPCAPVK
jgi:hypothetical protein